MPKNLEKKKSAPKATNFDRHHNNQHHRNVPNSQLNESENTNVKVDKDKDKSAEPSNEKNKPKQRKIKRHVNFNEIVYAFRINENWKVINWKENLKTENEQQVRRKKRRNKNACNLYRVSGGVKKIRTRPSTPHPIYKKIRSIGCHRCHR